MDKKILIIDDNHSFIDTLKYMLRDLPLVFESAFRFQEALNKISQNGRFLDGQALESILEFETSLRSYEAEKENLQKEPKKKNPVAEEETQKKLNELVMPEFPSIQANPFQDDGYSLLIVEYDTEVSVKGMQFIRDLVGNGRGWKYADFILTTNRFNELKPMGDSLGMVVLEKPLKGPQLIAVIQEKLRAMDDLQARVASLIERFHREEPQEKKKFPPQKKAVSIPAQDKPGKKPAKAKKEGKTPAAKKTTKK